MNHGIERVIGRCRLLGQLRTDLIYPLPVPLVPVVNLDKRAERGQLLPQRRVRVVGRVTMGRVERVAGLGLWKLRPLRGHGRRHRLRYRSPAVVLCRTFLSRVTPTRGFLPAMVETRRPCPPLFDHTPLRLALEDAVLTNFLIEG